MGTEPDDETDAQDTPETESSSDEETSSAETGSNDVETGTSSGDTVESKTVRVEEVDSESQRGHEDVTDEEQTLAVLTHASAFLGLVVPFGNIFAPLLVWLIKRDESDFLDATGKEAVNFQITWTLLFLVSLLTLLIGIGLLLVPIVGLAWAILVVVATIRASEREVYDYPLTFDFVG
jgi:uncharacterized Tic20 family protein